MRGKDIFRRQLWQAGLPSPRSKERQAQGVCAPSLVPVAVPGTRVQAAVLMGPWGEAWVPLALGTASVQGWQAPALRVILSLENL